MVMAKRGFVEKRRRKWLFSLPTNGASMTCMEMCGNGVQTIGMIIIIILPIITPG
jgi:hypothetical protein